MDGNEAKSQAQFWSAILSVGGLVAMTAFLCVWDSVQGHKTEITQMLVGGLLALGGNCINWLFPRNGDSSKGSGT